MRMSRRLLAAVAAVTLGSVPAAFAADQSPNGREARLPAQPDPTVAPAAALPNSAEMDFTMIAPCRAFGGQAISTPNTRSFLVAGAVNMTGQGGPAGGCGVPTYARAVSISLSAGTSTAQGYLTPYATGTARPNLAAVNYKTNPATSGTIVPVGDGGKINVFASSPTRVSGDITGYFVEPIHAVLSPSGGIYSGSGRVLTSERLGVGSYRVTLDRSPAECTPIASIDGSAYFASSYVTSGYVYANTYKPDGTPLDLYWSLHVRC